MRKVKGWYGIYIGNFSVKTKKLVIGVFGWPTYSS